MTREIAPDGPRVLVAGPEPAFTRQLEKEFDAVGFRVGTALAGTEVLAIAGDFDLIVLDGRTLDLSLPSLRQLHARYGPNTPSVLLLADDTSSQVDAALLVYPDSFVLAPPWTADAIVDAAARLLAVAA